MADSRLRKQLFDNEIKLNSIIDQEVKGVITRLRVKWTEEGERSTKYFFGLEKSNGKKKFINKLISPEKGVLHDQSEIPNHIVEFTRHFIDLTLLIGKVLKTIYKTARSRL